jgi:hypothetical protein
MAGKFSLDVSKFVNQYKIRIDLVIKKIVFDMFARIVLRSPVDTGRFRANWMIASGQMDVTTTEATDKSDDAAPTLAKLGKFEIKEGESVFITNSLPYAIPLEHGHSKQAPQGMVRITVSEFPGVVDQAVLEAQGGK